MITTIARLSYAALWEPKKNLSGVLKYSCSLLIPKTDEAGYAALCAAVEKATEKGKETHWGGKVPKFRYESIRDGDAELESGEKTGKEYAGHWFINCSSDNPPGIVGPNGKPLMEQGKLYSGCYVRADVNALPYKNSGNSGVGWGLNHIMLVKEGDRLDGRTNVEDAFAAYAEPEEGGESLM